MSTWTTGAQTALRPSYPVTLPPPPTAAQRHLSPAQPARGEGVRAGQWAGLRGCSPSEDPRSSHPTQGAGEAAVRVSPPWSLGRPALGTAPGRLSAHQGSTLPPSSWELEPCGLGTVYTAEATAAQPWARAGPSGWQPRSRRLWAPRPGCRWRVDPGSRLPRACRGSHTQWGCALSVPTAGVSRRASSACGPVPTAAAPCCPVCPATEARALSSRPSLRSGRWSENSC